MLGVMAFAAVVAGAASAATPEPNPATAIAVMQADAAVKAGDCNAAIPPLKVLWNDPNLSAADPKLASQTRIELIACTALTAGMPAALDLSAQNVSRADADIDAYDMHIYLQLVANQVSGAAAALDAALAKFPATASGLTDLSVMGTLIQVQDKTVLQNLLNRLEDAHWQVHGLSSRPLIDFYRLNALRAAVVSGDTVHAGLYRADIAMDSIIYVVSQGDGLISSADVPAQDIRPVLVKEIADLKAHVSQDPADLASVSLLISLERANGEGELAMVQLGGILDLVDKYGIDKFETPTVYDDLLTLKAEMLAEHGRGDEAKAAYDDGAKKLGTTDPTDLQLSHMNFLIDSGDEKAGLKLAESINPPQGDSYGAQLESLATHLACAYGYAGDEPDFAKVIAVLAQRPMARVKPYLCAGDEDGAAQSLIAALSDSNDRDEAILFMQDGVPPLPYGQRDQDYIHRLLALKKRPDVVAAAAANHILIRTWPMRF